MTFILIDISTSFMIAFRRDFHRIGTIDNNPQMEKKISTQTKTIINYSKQLKNSILKESPICAVTRIPFPHNLQSQCVFLAHRRPKVIFYVLTQNQSFRFGVNDESRRLDD